MTGLEQSIGQQLFLLVSALLTGLILEGAYELLACFRRILPGKLTTAVCDALFCLLFGLSLCLLGYTAGQGRQRPVLAALVMTGLGLGRVTLGRLFRYHTAFLLAPVFRRSEKRKKFSKKRKKLFHFWPNRFIISNRGSLCCRNRKNETSFSRQEAEAYEDKTSRYLY